MNITIVDRLLEDLTEAQQAAVTHVEGALLVLAAAGSGKTRVITRRVAYMLSQGIAGSSIVALTFTNKAAGEMRDRIDKLAPNSQVWVGTFHGLGARLLRTYASLVGIDNRFTIYDQADRLRAIKDTIERHQIDCGGVGPERIEGLISKAKNSMTTPRALARSDFDADHDAAHRVFPAYQARLRELSAVDFDDLLIHLVTILKEHPRVRAELDRRFRYVLVDEYQDTNLAQYAIVRGFSVDFPNLCVTGDPDQSIYAWRGANLSNILEFERDFPGCAVVKLERNYRSTKNILKVADTLIQHNRDRKPKALETENETGEQVELTIYQTEHDEAEGVARRIHELTSEGGFSLGEVAVFCRMTALTRNLERAFRSANLPYQIVGGVAFYERQEIKDMLAYLNLMINPLDDVSFDRVVNVPPRGLGKTSLDHLADWAQREGISRLAAAARADEIAALKGRAVAGLLDFARLMNRLAAYRDHPAEQAVTSLLALTGYVEYLRRNDKSTSDEREANIQELVSAAKEYDLENAGGSITGLLEQTTLASAVDRWKDDQGAVTLMTLHAAKGLEFPVVFIIALEEGLLPHSRSNQSRADLEEERRLFFVGITRAQRLLFLSRCQIREFRGQSGYTQTSQFLNELPLDVMTHRHLGARTPSLGLSGGRSPVSWSNRPPVARSSGFVTTPAHPATRPALMTAAELASGSSTLGPPPNIDAFVAGLAVRHPEYGLGKIVAIEGSGPNRKARVAFTIAGEKSFVIAKSPLRLLK